MVKNGLPKKGIIVAFVLTAVLVITSVSMAFADISIESLLNQWYQSKLDEGRKEITVYYEAELAKQKDKYNKEVDNRMRQAENEFAQFIVQEKSRTKKAIDDYMDKALKKAVFSKESEKAEAKAMLESIKNKAFADIDAAMAIYVQSKANPSSSSSDDINGAANVTVQSTNEQLIDKSSYINDEGASE